MSQTSPTPITALPAAPSTSAPSTFAALADAFIGALATFVSQCNAIATNVYNNAVDCYNNASAAAVANFATAFTFDSSTTMGAPATGGLRLNNATVASATAMAFNASSADTGNPNVRSWIATWGASTNTIKGYITIRKNGAPATFATFSISAAITDNTTWLQATVAYVAGNGTLSNSDALVIQFTRAGDAGVTNTASDTHASASKTTPVSADELPLVDSAASFGLKKLTWANLVAATNAAANTFMMAAANVYTKAQAGTYTTLADASTIAIDLSLGNFYRVILGGNRTLGDPTNAVAGTSFEIDVYQDGTGSRTLAYAWSYDFATATAIVLSTGKYTKDILCGTVNVSRTATVTMTIATPCVVTDTAHGMYGGQKIQIATTGALPTGVAVATTYWVVPIDANTYSLSSSLANAQAGTKLNTSGSQSGVHTLTAKTITLSTIGDVR